ncbi:MAG TPA: insulinase family protein [Acidobacteria bacterium]|nr:insulinase family protein [Acidobacteriota bacterium]
MVSGEEGRSGWNRWGGSGIPVGWLAPSFRSGRAKRAEESHTIAVARLAGLGPWCRLHAMSEERGDLPGLFVRRLPGRRAVSAGIWLVGGAAHDPAELAGATHLVEHLTLRRCGGRGRRELARLVDRLGGGVDAWTGAEGMGVTVQTTADALDEALDLLTDAVLEPTFDAADVELERRVALAELELARSDPEDRVEEAILRAAWGPHPLARPIIGDAESLARLGPRSLEEHHRRMIRPGGLLAVVCGDVDPGRVAHRLGRLPLGGSPVAPPLPALRFRAGTVVEPWPAGDQVYARLAFPGVGLASNEVTALLVLNHILGGGASSRLFQRLREEEGLTYDVFSGLILRRPGGLVEIGWACNATLFERVREVVWEELETLPGTLERREVAVAVESMSRGLTLDAEDASARCAMEASELLERGRPFELETAVAELKSVTVERLRELAARIFQPGSVARAVCGPEHVLERVA